MLCVDLRRLLRSGSLVKVHCLGSAPARFLRLLMARLAARWAARHSHEKAGPLRTQPLRSSARAIAASKTAYFMAFDHM